MNTNEYYETVRKDIAIEFGLKAAGYAPRPKYYITIREAQRLANKYDMETCQVIVKRLKAIRIANNWKG